MASVPDLTASLRQLAALDGQPPAPVAGPRRWWDGPLDVEGLALGAVQATATALDALTGAAERYTVSSSAASAAFNSLAHLRVDGREPQSFGPMSGFRQTLDGWIRLHANYPHHAAALMAAVGASDPEGVVRALLSQAAVDAEHAIVAAGGVAAAVRTRREWLMSPMYQAARSGPWISFIPPPKSGEHRPSSWLPSTDPMTPLAHLKVLDLTRVIAGPTATRVLAALGADVLRIDPPSIPELPDAFIDSGFNKRSTVADFRDDRVVERVQALAASADVVVSGYRDGALQRFGLDPDSLMSRNHGTVVATLSAWGRGGPWDGRRGFDSLVQAACGIAAQYGTEAKNGWRPGALPVQALDHATGYGLAAAVLALLAERLVTGVGGAARLSLARTAEELYRLTPANCSVPAESMPEPEYHFLDSHYGRLRFVGPPLLVDGVQLAFTKPPVSYGSSALAWW
ncbi:CoA transferase [Arthrobacter sp. SIMBA_036]|uniref:CoA transferase n=2 Tax=Bacteria TaxID=2 RepID=UPI003978A0E2